MGRRNAIVRAAKAAQQTSASANTAAALTAGGISPLVQQYQQWTMGRPTGPNWLPRSPEEFLRGAFAPLSPIIPVGVDEPEPGDERPEPRRYQYQVGWNMPVGEPGSEGLKLASFPQLRAFADAYSVARACIQVRKQEIRGLSWDIVPTVEAEKGMRGDKAAMKDFQDRRAKVLKFFRRPDPDYLDFSSWLDALLEELFVVDALALYLHPSRGRGKGLLGSDLAGLDLLDGTTIRPLVDLHGARPTPPNPAYQQYLWGVPRVDLTALIADDDADDLGPKASEYRGDQLLYLRYTSRTWTPYGFPPLERALVPIMAGLRRQQYQLGYFDEGSIPAVYVSPGENSGWTPQQMKELQDTLNAIAGDPGYKHKVVVLPPGSKVDPQRPVDLADMFDQIVTEQVCMAYDVMPTELGVTPGGRSAGGGRGASGSAMEAHQDVSDRKATKPLLLWLKSSIFDLVIRDICGQDDMTWKWEGLEEGKDAEQQMGVINDQITHGLKSIDEARVELGMTPWGLPMTSDPGILTATGFVPLGSIDPETGKPKADQPPPPAAGGAAPSSGAPGAAPGRPAPPVSPKPPASGTDAASRGGTPLHDGTNAAPKPAGKVPEKAAKAEAEALARHIAKGRDPDSWVAKFLTAADIDAIVKRAWDPSEHPRAAAGAAGGAGGEFVAGGSSSGGNSGQGKDWVGRQLARVDAQLAAAQAQVRAANAKKAAKKAAAKKKANARKAASAAKKQAAAAKRTAAHQAALVSRWDSRVESVGTIRDDLSGLSDTFAGAHGDQLDTAEAKLTAAARTLHANKPDKAIRQLLQAEQQLGALHGDATGKDATLIQRLMSRIDTEVRSIQGTAHPKAKLEHALDEYPKPKATAKPKAKPKPAGTEHATKAEDGGASPKADWPGWARDQALAAAYAPLIAAALAGGIDPAAMAREWLGLARIGRADNARGWLNGRGHVGRIIDRLKSVLSDLWTEAYTLGGRSAVATLHGGPVDWGAWTPGDVDTARLLSGGARGLQNLLDTYGIPRIKAIADTRADQLASVLQNGVAGGVAPDKLARDIAGILHVPSRAQMIADTEVARASSQAALDHYEAQHVDQVEWLIAPDERVCQVCQDNHDMGAVPVGTSFGHKPGAADGPPAHPGCRCVLVPAVDTVALTKEWDPGKHPRDDHGRFSVVDAMMSALHEHGGFTIDQRTGATPTTGYQVGVEGRTMKIGGEIPSIDQLDSMSEAELTDHFDRWLAENADAFDDPHMMVGGWHDTDTGLVHFDASEHVEDRDEAIRLGRQRNQISVWDNAGLDEIPTGGTGDVSGKQAGSVHPGSPEARLADDRRGAARVRRSAGARHEGHGRQGEGPQGAAREVTKVGPHGYEHGWIYVGPAHARVTSAAGKLQPSLTPEQRQSLAREVSTAKRAMSPAELRTVTQWTSGKGMVRRIQTGKVSAATAANFDQAMHSAPTVDGLVYRGVAPGTDAAKLAGTLKPGDTLDLGEPVSTSIDPRRAVSFGNYMFEIDSPAAAYISGMSAQYADEKEAVLAPGRFKVASVEYAKVGKIPVGVIRLQDETAGARSWLPTTRSDLEIAKASEARADRFVQGDGPGAFTRTVASKGADDPHDPNPVDAEHVANQLRKNYPEKAISWVKDARWIGPVEIPHDRIDTDDEDSWAASHQPKAVARFAKDIEHGRKHLHPVVAVQEPGESKVKVIDGHHRTLAYRKLRRPVPMYVGFVDSDGGPWDETHAFQFHSGGDPANKAGKLSKEEVHYRFADTAKRRCGTCSMFRANTDGVPQWGLGYHCTLVEGMIQPNHVCDRYDPADVQKADDGPVAAGLAVVADDTGRALMLQRAHTDDDPAAGMWEFPGGHVDDGETPLDAARREWSEETHLHVPEGKPIGEWTSPDGVYQGYVVHVPHESDVDVMGDRDDVDNPDDPDGDEIEALAWWDPDHLADNPAVRPELARDLDTVLEAL